MKLAAPIYETSVILLKGSYMAYVQLQGMTPEGLKSLNMDLGDGTLPKTGTGHLELIFGNGVITDFYETGSGNGYYDTGKVPNINLMKDSLFMITDTENYNSDSRQNSRCSEQVRFRNRTDKTCPKICSKGKRCDKWRPG